MATATMEGATSAGIPVYQPISRWGASVDLARDQIGTLTRGHAALGDTFRLPMVPGVNVVVVTHPRDVQRVLVDNARNYGKDTRGYDNLRLLVGNGLLTSQGDFWLRQRRISQPAFGRERVATFGPTMVRLAQDMARDMELLAQEHESVDVAAQFMKLTLRIVGETLLSVDTTKDAERVGHALQVALEFVNHRITHLLSPPMWVPTKANRAFQAAAKTLWEVVDTVLAERRRTGIHKEDLLSRLMEATDEQTGEKMTDGQLREEVMTMFLAGHETTAMALTWTVHEFGRNPQVAARLQEELASVLGGRTPVLGDLKDLPYLDRVLKEVMRLHPPAWIMGRNAIGDDVLGGYPVRKGSYLFVSPYLTQRSPTVWRDPLVFDPDRFLPERMASMHRLAYFPFSAGQRKCVGETFALQEAHLILAELLQRVAFVREDAAPVQEEPLVTLRPVDGLKMRVVVAPKVQVDAAAPARRAEESSAAAAGCPYHAAKA